MRPGPNNYGVTCDGPQGASRQKRPKVQDSRVAPHTERRENHTATNHRSQERGEHYKGLLVLLRLCRCVDFLELQFERLGLSDLPRGGLERLRRTRPRAQFLVDFLAQMTFQFLHWHWSLYAGGQHLSPPFRDSFIKVEHIL